MQDASQERKLWAGQQLLKLLASHVRRSRSEALARWRRLSWATGVEVGALSAHRTDVPDLCGAANHHALRVQALPAPRAWRVLAGGPREEPDADGHGAGLKRERNVHETTRSRPFLCGKLWKVIILT